MSRCVTLHTVCLQVIALTQMQKTTHNVIKNSLVPPGPRVTDINGIPSG